MEISRIPELLDESFDGLLKWFSEMSVRDLLFHPDDSPKEIVLISTGESLFTPVECFKLDKIIGKMFQIHGDGVYDAAYPIFMQRFGVQLDA